jgi:hypothetical protein
VKTKDRENVQALLNILNAPRVEKAVTEEEREALFRSALGRLAEIVVNALNLVGATDAITDHFTDHIVNPMLAACRLYPQVGPARNGKRSFKWHSARASDRVVEQQFDLIIGNILRLTEKEYLERVRKCPNPDCAVWYYAKNLKNQLHKTKCANRVKYLSYSPAERAKKLKDAAKRVKESREVKKHLSQKHVEASRRKERRKS